MTRDVGKCLFFLVLALWLVFGCCCGCCPRLVQWATRAAACYGAQKTNTKRTTGSVTDAGFRLCLHFRSASAGLIAQLVRAYGQ